MSVGVTRAWCVFGSEYVQGYTIPNRELNGPTVRIYLGTECGTVSRIAMVGHVAPFRLYPPADRCYSIAAVGAPDAQDLGDLSVELIAARLREGRWPASETELAGDAATLYSLLVDAEARGQEALRVDGSFDSATMTYGKVGRLAAWSEAPGVSVAPRLRAMVGLAAGAMLLLVGLITWPRRAKVRPAA